MNPIELTTEQKKQRAKQRVDVFKKELKELEEKHRMKTLALIEVTALGVRPFIDYADMDLVEEARKKGKFV